MLKRHYYYGYCVHLCLMRVGAVLGSRGSSSGQQRTVSTVIESPRGWDVDCAPPFSGSSSLALHEKEVRQYNNGVSAALQLLCSPVVL